MNEWDVLDRVGHNVLVLLFSTHGTRCEVQLQLPNFSAVKYALCQIWPRLCKVQLSEKKFYCFVEAVL